MKIGFLGAGNVASSLGRLLHAAGHIILFAHRGGVTPPFGLFRTPEQLAEEADIIVLALPFLAVREVLTRLVSLLPGKLIIDATNPVNADWSPMLLGEQNSAGEEVAKLLPASRVVKAFNTIFADRMRADRLLQDGVRVTCFVASDHAESAAKVAALATDAGFAPCIVGPLHAARYLESMAHLNIQLAVGMKGGTNAAFLYLQHQA